MQTKKEKSKTRKKNVRFRENEREEEGWRGGSIQKGWKDGGGVRVEDRGMNKNTHAFLFVFFVVVYPLCFFLL
jgi:hypothetical protein